MAVGLALVMVWAATPSQIFAYGPESPSVVAGHFLSKDKPYTE